MKTGVAEFHTPPNQFMDIDFVINHLTIAKHEGATHIHIVDRTMKAYRDHE